jgi:hypothetical protein
MTTLSGDGRVSAEAFVTRTPIDSGKTSARTPTEATALLNTFTTSAKGLVPAGSGGSTSTQFLRKDGTWAVPPGGGGGAADTFETVSANLAADDSTLFYSGGELDHIDYASGITKTFAYGVDGLSTVTLSGSTPGGIALVKTLTYVSGDLDSITYT